MRWGDLQARDNHRKVKVWADSTPKSPLTGEGPFVGIVLLARDEYVPILATATEVRYFAPWWQVEFLP